MSSVKPLVSKREQAANRKLPPKQFIETKLIPFILRDQGRGFAMQRWIMGISKGDEIVGSLDDIPAREAPSCGTVACIGGSIQLLTGLKFVHLNHVFASRYRSDIAAISSLLGISSENARALFYGWRKSSSNETNFWPESFRARFSKARTAYAKARVAASLLRQIAKRGDKVFKL